MRFLAAIPLLLLPLAASAAPGEPRIETFKMRSGPDQVARAERLGALPPGDLVLTVMRSAPDGCFAPVIVRQGYGGPAFRNGQR